MSAYGITPADLLKRLSSKQLAQVCLDLPSGVTADDLQNEAIDGAEAELHQAAGVFYVTPIEPSDEASPQEAIDLIKGVKKRILDEAAYTLLQRSPTILNAGERAIYWSQLKKSFDKWIRDISSSKESERVLLVGARERDAVVPSSGGAWAESSEPVDCNIFSREAMKGWT
jgi:hypothetical protein